MRGTMIDLKNVEKAFETRAGKTFVLRRIDLRAILAREGRGDLWREEWESDWTARPMATPTP